jgi:predicted ABC-type ATPase
MPVLIIVGGPNGCGKSTFAKGATGTAVLLGEKPINPDNLTAELQARQRPLSRRAADLVGVERAEKAVWRAIAEGRSAAVETVLSSDKYLAAVDAARERTYATRLIFVAVARVATAIERVAARVSRGGHGVPRAKIRARWKRSHTNLLRFEARVDDLLVFSNDGPEQVLVAARLGRSQPVVIYDPDALPEVSRQLVL